MTEAVALSQSRRIALILGVAAAGAIIGPLGVIGIGISLAEGVDLRGLAPVLGNLWKGVTTDSPVLGLTASSLIATVVFAPWFVSRIDRLARSESTGWKYYARAAVAGVVLGMLATMVNTIILLFGAALASPGSLAEPGGDGPLMIMIGVVFFGSLMGGAFAFLWIPVIAPIGAVLGVATGWVRNRVAR